MTEDLNDLVRKGQAPTGPLDGLLPVAVPPADTAAQASEGEGEPLPGLDDVRVSGFLADALARVKARCDGRELPLVTPWPGLNSMIGGGLWPGLVVLTGNTGSGKSQWALQVALAAAQASHPVLYVGLELDRLGLVCRLAALLTPERLQWADLYLGKVQTPDAFAKAKPVLETVPLYLDESRPGGWYMVDAEKRLKQMLEAYPGGMNRPCRLVVVDFLQIVGGPEKELRERIGRAAYDARILARRHNAVVVLISSTARENYLMMAGLARKKEGGVKEAKGVDALGAGDASRFVGLGKESGEIEYAADLVLALCRERQEEGGSVPPVWLAIAKQRAGVSGWCRLGFDGCRFSEGGSNGITTGRRNV